MNCRNCGAPINDLYCCAYCKTTMAARGDTADEWEVRLDQQRLPAGYVNRRTGQFRAVLSSPQAVREWFQRNGVVG